MKYSKFLIDRRSWSRVGDSIFANPKVIQLIEHAEKLERQVDHLQGENIRLHSLKAKRDGNNNMLPIWHGWHITEAGFRLYAVVATRTKERAVELLGWAGDEYELNMITEYSTISKEHVVAEETL